MWRELATCNQFSSTHQRQRGATTRVVCSALLRLMLLKHIRQSADNRLRITQGTCSLLTLIAVITGDYGDRLSKHNLTDSAAHHRESLLELVT